MRSAGDEYSSGNEIFGWGGGEDLFSRLGREEQGVSCSGTEFQEIEWVDKTTPCFMGISGCVFIVEFFTLRDRPSARDENSH